MKSAEAERLAAGLRRVAREMDERTPAPAAAALELGAMQRRLSREPPDHEHPAALVQAFGAMLRAAAQRTPRLG